MDEISKDSSQPNKRIAVGLYGAGGFAREVMPLLRVQAAKTFGMSTNTLVDLFFIETHPNQGTVNDLQVISEDQFFELDHDQKWFNIAIADSATRELLASTCIARGGRPIAIQSEHSALYDCNDIGEGAIFCANTIVTSNAKIGKFFHANIYSYIAHDCVIGNYVTFAPRVNCNGNVHIHDHAYIGTGAIIKQGTPDKPTIIGHGAVVGMGAVVTKDVDPFTTVIGNPAKVLQR
jgi:sugar O-acyltransferase (sialic acid O-acetyltransferase NeuD family)